MNYLQIVKNNEVQNISINKLFDSNTYDTVKVVSFVSSPTFVINTLKEFDNVELILGIEDSEFLTTFTVGIHKSLYPEEIMNTWNDFDVKVKEKILSNKIKIRYPVKGMPVHSKFYILSSSKSSDTRVIIGSANFTQKAFAGKQYEEVLVYDNNADIFNIFNERYSTIQADTVDYIYDKLKTKYVENKEKEIVYFGDKEELILALHEEGIEELKVFDKTLTEDEIRGLYSALENKEVEIANDKQVSLILDQIIKTKPSTDLKIFKTQAEFNKIKNKIVFQKNKRDKNAEDADPRYPLIYDSYHKRISEISTYEDQKISIPFSKESVDPVKLKENILGIHKFIDGYEKFTVNSDLNNQKRVYEMILYTLTSPMIFKLRDEYVLNKGRESDRSSISPFLIVGGRARSGKSVALEFCHHLLFGNKQIVDYAEIHKNLHKYLNSEIVSPLMVDELPKSFFTSSSENKGERLFKTFSNSKKGAHPSFISTTNASGFGVNQQSSRRIYYLEISNPFREDMKDQSDDLIDEVYNMVDNSLFLYFLHKMENTKYIFNSNDLLATTRSIIKDIYNELNIPLPAYFPEKTFNDYKQKGIITWDTFFSKQNDFFTIDNKKDRIYIDEKLFNNDKALRAVSIGYLPSESIVEDATVLILNKSNFLDFIKSKNNSNFLSKLFPNKFK